MKFRMHTLALAALTLPLTAVAAEGAYIGFELGANSQQRQHLSQQDFNFVNIDTKKPFKSGRVLGLTGGWVFANGLRAELEYADRSNDLKNFNGRLYDGGGSLEGKGTENAVSMFANLWYDFQPVAGLFGIRPYVGAGLGRTRIRVNDLEAGGVSFGSASATVNSYQIGVGASYEVKPNVALSLDFRRLKAQDANFGSIRNIPPGDVKGGYSSNSLNLGLRYTF